MSWADFVVDVRSSDDIEEIVADNVVSSQSHSRLSVPFLTSRRCGQANHVCPFHATRDLMTGGGTEEAGWSSALILITYQQLINVCVREASGTERVIDDAIIVVDVSSAVQLRWPSCIESPEALSSGGVVDDSGGA